MESAKNVRWIIPFKKFGMVRVNCPTNAVVNIITVPLYAQNKSHCTITFVLLFTIK